MNSHKKQHSVMMDVVTFRINKEDPMQRSCFMRYGSKNVPIEPYKMLSCVSSVWTDATDCVAGCS